MKLLTAVLTTLLLMAICSLAEAQRDDSETTVCCFHYARRRIPRKLITSFYMTGAECPQPAVVLVTTKGMDLCVDPEAPWVQEYLKHFENLENRSFPPATPV